MLPLEMVRGYDLTLSQLSTAALADLRALMTSLEDVSQSRQQAVLQEAFPEVFNPYAAASSAVSASFYEEVRDYAEVKGSFDAETLDSVDTSRWGALVGFGTAPRTLERGGSALVFSLLSGGLTSVLTSMAADTIAGNAALDPVTVGYQRVPKPGCCGFCGMLASRTTSMYQSEDAALKVVGRGMPIPKVRQRGGQARGIRPRGTQALGEKFHDHCKCTAAPVFAGQEVQMHADAEKYNEAYTTARDNVNKGLTLEAEQSKSADGSLKNTYRWVDADGGLVSSKDKTKLIAKAVRHELDVK